MAATISSSDDTSRNGRLVCESVLQPPLERLDSLTYRVRQPAWQCSFSPDGTYLAVAYGAPGPCIRIWRRTTSGWVFETTLAGVHDRTVRSVAFAPVVRPWILASASFDGSLAIWESNSTKWECMAQLEGHDNEVKCVVFNETGSLLASSGRDKTIWIWECFLPGTVGADDTAGGGDFECISVLSGHESDVKCVRFAPSHGQFGDGPEILLSASYDNTIQCWAEDDSSGDWYGVATIAGVHSSTIWSLAVSPSGTRLVSASADGSLGLYKAYSAAEAAGLDNHPDGNTTTTTTITPAATTGLWKCVGTLPQAHALGPIYSVAYASSKVGHGRVASAGADGRVQIYREAMGSTSDQPVFHLDCSSSTADEDDDDDSLQSDVNCVAWHPTDGNLLVSATDDGSVQVWKYSLGGTTDR